MIWGENRKYNELVIKTDSMQVQKLYGFGWTGDLVMVTVVTVWLENILTCTGNELSRFRQQIFCYFCFSDCSLKKITRIGLEVSS